MEKKIRNSRIIIGVRACFLLAAKRRWHSTWGKDRAPRGEKRLDRVSWAAMYERKKERES